MGLEDAVTAGLNPVSRGALRPSRMNGTERAYSVVLEARRQAGELLWWAYEVVTLKLADDTRYTPDFAVMLANGELEMHETKGFMRDDAWVKLKVAAEKFPFRFRLVKREKGAWTERVI